MRASRRHFLRLLGGAAAAAQFAGAGERAFAADAALTVTDLRGLLVVSGGGGNVVLLPSAAGTVAVDSGAAETAERLLAVIGERATAPISHLFNTHWHPDHTGGNDAIVARFTPEILAHENTRLWMSTKFYVDWEDRYYQRRSVAAQPNRTFFSSDPQPLQIDVAGERIVYGHLPEAHTDGDIYVRFPQRNVIVAGGAVSVGRYPVLDYITGGWIGGLVDATEALIALCDEQTLVVPDLGPPQGRADLEVQREMLTKVREGIEAIALEGRGLEEMLAAGLTKDFESRYGTDSAEFISNAYEGMWWNRLRGIVA